MDRVLTAQHKGKTIIILDVSKCPPEDTLKVLEEAKSMIAKLPPKSALVLTDVTEATYNKPVAEAMKDFVSHNTPYVKGSAVVGADGVRLVLLNTVIFISRREIKTFDTREDAMDWLAALQ